MPTLVAGSKFPVGAMKCVGKCTAYGISSGVVGVSLGSGSADFSLAGSPARSVKASKSGDSYGVANILVGPRNRSARVSGSNFVLLGLASATVKISDVADAQIFATELDPSLDDPIQKNLNRYGFRASDFSSEWSIFPMGRGTTLEDPTLDLCNGVFLSEKERVERRQISATKLGSTFTFLSSEVVRYSSAAAATAAQNQGRICGKHQESDAGKSGVERAAETRGPKARSRPIENEEPNLRNRGAEVGIVSLEAIDCRLERRDQQSGGPSFWTSKAET